MDIGCLVDVIVSVGSDLEGCLMGVIKDMITIFMSSVPFVPLMPDDSLKCRRMDFMVVGLIVGRISWIL